MCYAIKRRAMMKTFSAVFILLALCISLPHIAEAEFEKTKIAVLDFQLQGKGYDTEDMGKIVAEWLITALVKEGRFEVIERRLLEKVMREQQLVMEGVVDSRSAVKLGELLGVKVIITGSVMRFQNILEVNARIIDVKDASIIAAEIVRSSTARRLEELVVQMAEQIIKDFPLEGYIVNKTGDKVVIDLGKRTGVKTGMKFMIFKEGNVIKHPKTGEVLDIEKIQTGLIEITSVSDKIAKGKIIETNKNAKIDYGQMVKSLTKPLKVPDSVPTRTAPPPVTARKAPAEADYSATDLSGEEIEYISMLRSDYDKNKTYAAKKIFKSQLFHPEILKVVNEELLKGYDKRLRDRHHIETMSYLCKILGASGDSQYKSTLETVFRSGAHRKLKGYARKSYNQLP
jgi:TolB-like protein